MAGKNVIDIESVKVKKRPAKANKEKKAMSPRQQKQRKKKIIKYMAIGIFLMATIGYSSYKMLSLQLEKNRLETEQENLKQERDKLKKEAENSQNIEYVEEQAREQLHLVLPGEILYMLPEEDQEETKNEN